MEAIQSTTRQLLTSDIMSNVTEALEAYSRLQEKQEKVHADRGQQQGLVWVAEAEMNSLKARKEHAQEHCHRSKSNCDNIGRLLAFC